ncbi:MAG: DNA polymerase III subunit gamma and tau [Actinomycetota bacterium]|nr:DNA polymerase III subunit gamma and tau [Actinomycetota bacterium]
MDAPLALYRRYRPETFAEVIGQDHVTEPLRHALAANRVNHAYLFSGPRGCGKTTSARILARALNCEKAPIADPCGECQSCRDLARGGPGSMDVIEIDAASHGGVDDARDLRERAFFAPVSSRYKVYIIDEAHMVSPQGFNALLKLVEEPPPHLKFIFATTEPDKVIGTIRSRTHHYPFRLVPPKVLGDYLLQLCEAEGVTLDPLALPLVVRAGAGSVRDTLSVLDQLLGGAGPDGVTYELASTLLGYTPDSLLDEVIDALAAGDGATVFGVVDKVIETGQDPRRFAEDLLQRLRDLIIVSAVPNAIENGLLEVPGDRAERLQNQAGRFGPSDLTRAADLISDGLLEFRGATAPRLLLELMCARILLPGADHSTQGFQARLDRLERRLAIDPSVAVAAPAPVSAPPAPVSAPPAESDVSQATRRETPAERHAERVEAPEPVAEAAVEPQPETQPEPQPEASRELEPTMAAEEPHPEPHPEPTGAIAIADVRRLWPDILDKVKVLRRFTWVMLSQNAQVTSLDGDTLTISLVNVGARDSFLKSGSDAYVHQAIHQVLGTNWKIDTIVDPSAEPMPQPDQAAPAPTTPRGVGATAEVREAISNPQARQTPEDVDAAATRDDPIVEVEEIDPEQLLTRELGAEVIEEITSNGK